MKKKAAFYTLGCKVNEFDTDAMMEIFKNADYEIVPFNEVADIYIINTCTVTHTGDQKSRNMIRRAKKNNNNAIVIASGCYAQVAAEELRQMDEVDIVLGTQNRLQILDIIEVFQKERKNDFVFDNTKSRVFEELTVSDHENKTRAYIKVQEGCDQFCSYCIIPYARGRVRSRSVDSVLSEAKRLVSAGHCELVITGIHVVSYGKEFNDNTNLLTLIQQLDQIDGVKRIRLSSLEPMFLTDDIICALSKINSFCPHFHLSLQSGCDSVLKRMNRKYTTAQYAHVVQKIRGYFEHPAITTDIMVGFPGETDDEFQMSFDFAKEMRFYQMHVFKYSKRKGTVAAKMLNQIDEAIKKERSQRLIELSKSMEKRFLLENHGEVADVLLEQEKGNDFTVGHTMNYIPVFCKKNKNNCGKIVQVELSYNQQSNLMIGSSL